MPKRQRSNKKGLSTFWQWVLVALAAFIFYKGLDYFLSLKGPKTPKGPTHKIAKDAAPGQPSATPSPSPGAGPVKKWNFESAAPFLPPDAYEDNFQTVPLKDETDVLLAYAQKKAGVQPGPQGLTGTRPGVRYLRWDGKNYQTQEISLKELEAALGNLSIKNFQGLPQIEKKSMKEGETEIFPAKLFLSGDDREVVAFLSVDSSGLKWAPLHHASGKKMPAAFVQGTTRESTQKISQQKNRGKNYLIIEHGVLDEFRTYEGYDWRVQAYFWDGMQFAYDKDYSDELTKAKKVK